MRTPYDQERKKCSRIDQSLRKIRVFFSKPVLDITQNFEFVKVSKNAIVNNPLYEFREARKNRDRPVVGKKLYHQV